MQKSKVNLDFEIISKSFASFVRDKAIRYGSTIVYSLNDALIEENPSTKEIKILKHYSKVS